MPRALLTASLGMCAGLIIVSLLSPDKLNTLRLRATQVAAPIAWLYQTPIDTATSVIDVVKSYLFVRDRTLQMEAEIAALRPIERAAERLSVENAALRRQLGAAAWPAQIVATGRVLSHGGGTYLKSILLAAGRDAGVEPGHAVVSSAGLVGQVVAVAPRLSRVLLINDFSSRIPIVIDGTATPGIAEGTNAPVLALSFLPIDYRGKDGALISTSGAGGLFPAGVPVGWLEVRQGGDAGVYGLRPYADLTATGFLSVLKPLDADMPDTSPLPRQLIDPSLTAAQEAVSP